VSYNIADLFESIVDVVPSRVAVVSGDTQLSYAELDARANRLARFLRSRGVGPGQHVGLHLWNGHEFVEGMLAAFKLRAVPININYRYVADELRYLCDNADLVAVLTQSDYAETMRSVAANVPGLTTTIVVGGAPGRTLPQGSFHYADIQASGGGARDFGPRSGEDLYIVYTGGTTGKPKGVMWRHEDVFFAGLQGGNPGGAPIERPEQLAQNVAAQTNPPLTFLPAAPLIHGAAQWSVWIGMFGGGKIVLQPGRSFNAAGIAELIEKHKANTLTLVGDAMARPFVEAVSESERRYDLSSLFVIASAGAVFSPVVRQQIKSVLPNILLINSFGSTEAGHQGNAYHGAPNESGQEGRPSFMMDGNTNTVFDDERQPIQPGSGRIGLLARSGRLPVGYYKEPGLTAERFIEVNGKRWVLPGDCATIEGDGRITIFGRGSVCINTGGEKVFPEEIEEILKSHAAVFDAVVVGVDDARWMQRVAAVVEVRPGAGLTLDEMQAHCRQHAAGYKVPRMLTIVEKVVRSPSGKPDYEWAKRIASRAEAPLAAQA
jgi:acyl-CoA synthetase (AMP-forming)/AMP-acid ligase II